MIISYGVDICVDQIIMDNYLNEFTKVGLSKLMRPFENSPDDIYKLTKAFSVAFNLHAGISRNNNKNDPYINHCLRVSLILSEEISCRDINALCRPSYTMSSRRRETQATIRQSRSSTDFGNGVGDIITTLSRNSPDDRRVEYLQPYFEKIVSL